MEASDLFKLDLLKIKEYLRRIQSLSRDCEKCLAYRPISVKTKIYKCLSNKLLESRKQAQTDLIMMKAIRLISKMLNSRDTTQSQAQTP